MKKILMLGLVLSGVAQAADFTTVNGALLATDKDYTFAAVSSFGGQVSAEILSLTQKSNTSNNLWCTSIKNMGVQGDSLILRYDVFSGSIDRQMAEIVFADKTQAGVIAGNISGCAILRPEKTNSYIVYVPKNSSVRLPSYFSDYVMQISMDDTLKMTGTLSKK